MEFNVFSIVRFDTLIIFIKRNETLNLNHSKKKCDVFNTWKFLDENLWSRYRAVTTGSKVSSGTKCQAACDQKDLKYQNLILIHCLESLKKLIFFSNPTRARSGFSYSNLWCGRKKKYK